MNLLADLQVYYSNITKKWCMILALIGLFVSSYIISWNTETFSQIKNIVQRESGNSLTRVNHFGTKVKKFDEKKETPYLEDHSSEIRGLCSTKCSSKTLQNLLYFMYKKTHVVFFVFHFVQLYIFTL